jgi:hypothetical protein
MLSRLSSHLAFASSAIAPPVEENTSVQLFIHLYEAATEPYSIMPDTSNSIIDSSRYDTEAAESMRNPVILMYETALYFAMIDIDKLNR